MEGKKRGGGWAGNVFLVGAGEDRGRINVRGEREECGKVRIVIADVGTIAAEAGIRILGCWVEWGMEGGVYSTRCEMGRGG